MSEPLPENFTAIGREERFCFSCHPGVGCFTDCCRQLDLALTPYDVLRLRHSLKMDSASFLKQYVIVEWEEGTVFPQCYLTMVDDGRASCVFVSPEGCTVYRDRPSACRAYPVGRGASLAGRNGVRETFVLVREPHCLGFAEETSFTPAEYFADQEVGEYTRFNDALLPLTQHPSLQAGRRLTRQEAEKYLLALYDLDALRRLFRSGRLEMGRPLSAGEEPALADDDRQLLLLGIDWLKQELFADDPPGRAES